MYIKSLPSFSIGTKYIVEITGGEAPFTWYVTGTDFSFGSPTTTERTNIITASESGTLGTVEEITVTDSKGVEVSTYCTICGNVVCCDDSSFSFNPYNKTEVVEGKSIPIAVIGGCPPFVWIANTEGFSFMRDITNIRSNYLKYDKHATIVGNIEVYDICEMAWSVITTNITGVPNA